jgi:hypothetical protein
MVNGDAGKGDAPRPVDPKRYGENYERIFGKRPDYKKVIANGRKFVKQAEVLYAQGQRGEHS